MAELEQKNENVNTAEENSQATPTPVKPKTGEDVSIRYRGLTFDMAVELMQAEEEYFFWDLPVPFGEKLKLYPVNIKDYNTFMDAISCFLLDKKQLPPNSKPADIKKQLKMTDLEYLISKFEDPSWRIRFVNLVKLVFHVENGIKCPHCGRIITYQDYKTLVEKTIDQYVKEQTEKMQQGLETQINEGETEIKAPAILCPDCGGDGLFETIKYEQNEETQKLELFIDGQKIDFKDFIRIKNLVLFQNMPDYRDTSYIDPQLKKDYETRQRIKGQQNNKLSATLEKKIVALSVFKHLPNYDDIYAMTIRKFLMEFATMDDLISYLIGMMGRVCGLGGGPSEIEHWIYKEIKDVYSDGGYVSKDTMMEKVKSVS